MNTQDKARFFAQYWEQKVMSHDEYVHGNTMVDGISISRAINYSEDYYLELSPLNQITDEHAIEAYCLETGETTEDWPESYMVDEFHKMAQRPYNFRQPVIDFLRKHGYLVPFDKYNCEELI